jgi:fumarate hydratase subunit alpha
VRTIGVETIIRTVADLCARANTDLDGSILDALHKALADERSPEGRDILERLDENAAIAADRRMAICQDTGMAVLFVEAGQDLRVEGGSLGDALQEGVRRGYRDAYLRNSVVRDPFDRTNTGDNTPAVIHYDIVPGDRLAITVAPKGFGSENMSALRMLKPSDGIEGVRRFVLDTVSAGGANACPPMILGVGVGGTMEKCALLAKKALLRPVGAWHPDPKVAAFEKDLLASVNRLGIGPAGLGGTVTALWVAVETFATHIAGLPAAVNVSCHATRHAEAVL